MNFIPSTFAIFWCLLGLQNCEAQTFLEPEETVVAANVSKGQFDKIYEPSAVQVLSDGLFLMAEDEAKKPFSLARLSETHELKELSKPHIMGRIDDIEGLTGDNRGNVYAITSHSRTKRGNKQRSRNKFLRFSLTEGTISNPRMLTNLRDRILKKYDVIDEVVNLNTRDFNIEGLGYRSSDNSILIGLRTPLIDDQSVIVVMKNPNGVFEDDERPEFSKKPIFLDLDKGGIRSIVYDDHLKGYLILSRREDRKDKAFKLWIWGGESYQKPKRIKFKSNIELDGAEGITPFQFKSSRGLLIVKDNGEKRKHRGANYVIIEYDQIYININAGM